MMIHEKKGSKTTLCVKTDFKPVCSLPDNWALWVRGILHSDHWALWVRGILHSNHGALWVRGILHRDHGASGSQPGRLELRDSATMADACVRRNHTANPYHSRAGDAPLCPGGRSPREIPATFSHTKQPTEHSRGIYFYIYLPFCTMQVSISWQLPKEAQKTDTTMVRACHAPRQPLQKHTSGHLGGWATPWSAQESWMDNVKQWTSLPMPDLLKLASRKKTRKRSLLNCPQCHAPSPTPPPTPPIPPSQRSNRRKDRTELNRTICTTRECAQWTSVRHSVASCSSTRKEQDGRTAWMVLI